MSKRSWFRSLYWRIAFGFVALLAAVLLVQTLLFLWLTNRLSPNTVTHTPAQLAVAVAGDIASQLGQHPALDIEPYLQSHYGRSYQPFVVVLRDGRHGSNRPTALPPLLTVAARRHLLREDRAPDRGADRTSERAAERAAERPIRFRTIREEFAPIEVNGLEAGMVAVPSVPPGVFIG